ncbi:OLC1v1024476C1 [Oldenlandia corymbosa var. corymbosa]|uniref:OLC1v1024476C1 n=1 Tax=Oldenlandia corymbosa var. corymbosa TaxID=529605 RepID=A0AAV1C4W7_OLDCO|nr:OLC1v1024476C1 [Oldenlandia corymbosa var. corymbosa]
MKIILHKLFGKRKLAPAPNPNPMEDHQAAEKQAALGESPAALKIIHAGGRVELYYMAIPAERIIEKYPYFTLARPDVFRRPWDAIVPPNEILVPGQKYFVVSLRTVKKLRRRIKKPIVGSTGLIDSGSGLQITDSSCDENFSSSSFVQNRFGILIKSKSQIKTRNRRVRFFGIDGKKDVGCSEKNGAGANDRVANRSLNDKADGEKKRSVRSCIVQWQPSLTSINEDHFNY